MHECTELARLDTGDASCTPGNATLKATYDICCTNYKENKDGDPPSSNDGDFNCFDGDPTNTDDPATYELENQYFGYGTTVAGRDYMCIRDGNSTTSNWNDPNSTGAGGGAPLCPSSRRLMERRMEELFSSYRKHNSKVQLTQPQSYKSPEKKTTKTTKEVDASKHDEIDIPSCRMGVPIADVRRLSADQCNPSATPEKFPLEIISRSGKTVTFTLSQVWKECNYGSSTNKMDWIAADFVVPENGELECFKTSRPDCGIVNAFTAKCTEGLALIDIYAVDETATGIFYQTDGSALTIPDACASGGRKGDATKACKFRYVLNCMEACEDDKETLSWWTTESMWKRLTDAFRRG